MGKLQKSHRQLSGVARIFLVHWSIDSECVFVNVSAHARQSASMGMS